MNLIIRIQSEMYPVSLYISEQYLRRIQWSSPVHKYNNAAIGLQLKDIIRQVIFHASDLTDID